MMHLVLYTSAVPRTIATGKNNREFLNWYEPVQNVQVATTFSSAPIFLDARHTSMENTGFSTFKKTQNVLENLQYHLLINNDSDKGMPLVNMWNDAIKIGREFITDFELRYSRYATYPFYPPSINIESYSFEYFSVTTFVEHILILEEIVTHFPNVSNSNLKRIQSDVYRDVTAALRDYQLFVFQMMEELEREFEILDSLGEGEMSVILEEFIIEQLDHTDGYTYKIGDFTCNIAKRGPVCNVEILSFPQIESYYRLEGLPIRDMKLLDEDVYSRQKQSFDLIHMKCARIADSILFECIEEAYYPNCNQALNQFRVEEILSECTFTYVLDEQEPIIETLEWIIYINSHLLQLGNETKLPQAPFHIIGIKSNKELHLEYNNRIISQPPTSDEFAFSTLYFTKEDILMIEDFFDNTWSEPLIYGSSIITIGILIISCSVCICVKIVVRRIKPPTVIFKITRDTNNRRIPLENRRMERQPLRYIR